MSEIDRSVFTGSLAVVDQDIILFEDTIANNIKMWDNSIEDFEVILAAKDAQLHEDIMMREGGYNYKLTEGGKDFSGGDKLSKSAVDGILRYYRVKTLEVPETVKDFNEQLEYLLRPHGIMRRTVKLEKGWYKDAVGPYLVTRKSDGATVAMIPGRLSGYCYIDGATGKRVKVNQKNEGDFEVNAVAFYKPFPLKKLSIPDLMKYVLSTLSAADLILFALSALVATAVGLMTPKLQNFIFSTVIDVGSIRLLTSVAIFLICVSVSQLILGGARDLLTARMNTKMSIYVQSATMMRVMSLPPSFFKEYSSGELSSRAQYISSLCNMLVSMLMSTGLTSVFSLVYVGQIFIYAPALVAPRAYNNNRHRRVFVCLHDNADEIFKDVDGAGRKTERLKLRDDLGNTEDKARRSRKEGICKVGGRARARIKNSV